MASEFESLARAWAEAWSSYFRRSIRVVDLLLCGLG